MCSAGLVVGLHNFECNHEPGALIYLFMPFCFLLVLVCA